MEIPKNCEGKELNKPFNSNRKFKKRQVCVNDGKKIVNIHYGDKRYNQNYSKKARDSFRARHKCDSLTKKDKSTARWWACEDLWDE